MAHGTEDSTHTTPGGEGNATAPGRGTGSRFAAARNVLTRRGRPGAEEPAVARALRVAEGEEEVAGDTDWRSVGLFGAGLAIGALFGAGVALLLAPASGFETRMRLARSARRTGSRLRSGARQGTRDLKRGVSRKMTLGRWAAEDAWERRRRRRLDED